jgi:hypothetical protein
MVTVESNFRKPVRATNNFSPLLVCIATIIIYDHYAFTLTHTHTHIYTHTYIHIHTRVAKKVLQHNFYCQ